ncbi:peptidase inhibitor family I36 protein [Streptomyces collinus]|uniref:peptidase inhibitor family I36 protein n=1 Tax=Streptomyces collinus TaxID=42684 RepID=UPI0033B06241
MAGEGHSGSKARSRGRLWAVRRCSTTTTLLDQEPAHGAGAHTLCGALRTAAITGITSDTCPSQPVTCSLLHGGMHTTRPGEFIMRKMLAACILAMACAVPAASPASAVERCTSNFCFWPSANFRGNMLEANPEANPGLCYRNHKIRSTQSRASVQVWASKDCTGDVFQVVPVGKIHDLGFTGHSFMRHS